MVTKEPLKVIVVKVWKEESSKESCKLLRKYLSRPEQNGGRNLDGENHSDEVSHKNEKRVIG